VITVNTTANTPIYNFAGTKGNFTAVFERYINTGDATQDFAITDGQSIDGIYAYG
jgi:hypothetical protein